MSAQEKSWEELELELLRDIEAFVDAIPVAPAAAPARIKKTEENTFPQMTAMAASAPAPVQRAPTPAAPAVIMPTAAPAAAPMPAPMPTAAAMPLAESTAPASGGSLLDKLKREASAKQAAADQGSNQIAATKQRIGVALDAVFQYFNELFQQLNVLKAPLPASYNLLGLATIDGMSWQEGRADYRLQLGYHENRIIDNVSLNYRIGSNQTQTLTRETPTHNAFRTALLEWNLGFTSTEVRNAKGGVESVVFKFPNVVKATMILRGDAALGVIRLQLNNVRRFGQAEYLIPPEAVDQMMLEDLGCYLMGEASSFDRKFKRAA